ncbi:PPR: pentatricopeptide repeat domain containing protein [Nitzschia inconspicua]|uniref:PPR: pentatricopeptide repeat domain containing protein n=1 Tax=Nitzschia inconspicua TaxID=303405 RepID=A0A9K3PVQ7_9STRA|nr:PPR: pentatricopeptide repeat domain containing protein [Nitzschia inconspicua]
MVSDEEENFHADAADTVGQMHSEIIAQQLPSDAPVISDTPSLDSFVQSIHGNVQLVLDSIIKISTESNQKSRRRSVQERWKKIYDKEKQRHNRRTRKPRIRISVEQMWEQALSSMGLPTILTEEEVVAVGPPPNPLTDAASDAIKSDKADSTAQKKQPIWNDSGAHSLSPIFGLPLNEQLQIDDIQSLLADHLDGEVYPTETNLADGETMEKSISSPKETERHQTDSREQKEKLQDAILQAIALLTAVDPNSWQQLHRKLLGDDDEFVNDLSQMLEHDVEEEDDNFESGTENERTDDNMVQDYIRHSVEHNRFLTTAEANLMLAHLAVSSHHDLDFLIGECMSIYNEMKLMQESGQAHCQPDANTYRKMILALCQRFMAAGEAIKLSREMMHNSTIEITPEVFLEAIKACHIKMDLKSARAMMEVATRDAVVRPSLGSYLILVEMMKADDLREETLAFFKQLVADGILLDEAADKVLHSICRWPRRTRRGDFIDLSSFQLQLLATVQQLAMDERKPGISLWVQLIGEMHVSARTDPSLWSHINSALYTILELYPEHGMGSRLMNIGLQASVIAEDPKLAAAILSNISSVRLAEEGKEGHAIDIPFQAVKSVMEVCLKVADARSAELIMHSIEKFGDSYPTFVLRQLYSLLLLCHAKAGKVDDALYDLLNMTEEGMKPGEDLYAAVLHTLAVTGKQEEAETLFEAMQRGTNGVSVKPSLASYDAILLGRTKSSDWEGTIELHETMSKEGFPSSPQTVERLMEAHDAIGGTDAVFAVVERFLQDEAVQFDENPFRSLSKRLLPNIEIESFDNFRQRIRRAGEARAELRDVSLNLIRSLRVAEIESERPSSRHKTVDEIKAIQDMAWKKSVSDLLEFARKYSNEDRIE